ncbi:LCP family protein required for cell wall assembly [Nocardioides cavernae]|uniref:LCP family protein required for cell wall assembly n=1 Tax=Nocardioides cavernae TaxID=1921566 RepID=A0A7Y9H577_9ACTN|nr:LCP family protein [Nocardioides cavernae]NYE37449.1 LCP family protein required for cell wall assembly [Nocardioides cavernae]
MPAVPPPGSHQPRFTTLHRAQRVRFRRAVTLMLMTLVVPGSAQLVSGNRRVGRIALWTWLVLVVGGVLAVVTAYFWHGLAFKAGTDTFFLQLLRLGLMLLAVGWAYLFVDAWRLGQPLTLQRQHRLAVVGVNGVLCFSVAGALLFGAHVVGVQRDFMITMFGDGAASGSTHGRYNILLMGGDAGAGRWGLRPDSMTVASIDEETGKTVLISLPRNMQNFPFAEGSVMDEQFPDGFDEEGMYLNGLATWALDHADLFEGSKNPGVDATVMGVEGITGLDINYWAMVNLEGFKDLVDAVGGVELNVRQRIPVGLPSDSFFRYIEPGKRTLNGMDTLWFARARHDSDDYSRMARQKCVMSAMLQQVSPQVALRNFEKIAGASSAMVSTDVPRSEVDRFVDLALKAKSQKIATLSLVPPMINTANPDIDLVHAKVQAAIAKAEGRTPATEQPADTAEAAAPETDAATDAGTDAETDAATDAGGGDTAATPSSPTTPSAPTPSQPPAVTGGSVGSLSTGYAANQSEDLGAVC